MWKNRPTDGTLYAVKFRNLAGFFIESLLLEFDFLILMLWLVASHLWSTVIIFRYSDRVKAESERLNGLELDDLEVSSQFKICINLLPRVKPDIWWLFIFIDGWRGALQSETWSWALYSSSKHYVMIVHCCYFSQGFHGFMRFIFLSHFAWFPVDCGYSGPSLVFWVSRAQATFIWSINSETMAWS